MLFGYSAFFIAWLLGIGYFLSGALFENILHTGMWLLFTFFIFLINGHLYKIVPFLVWFHRYSDKVGKEKVPMLHEMYPKKQADFQFYFSVAGAVLIALALLSQNGLLMRAGSSFLSIGALFLVFSLFWMLRFGRR